MAFSGFKANFYPEKKEKIVQRFGNDQQLAQRLEDAAQRPAAIREIIDRYELERKSISENVYKLCVKFLGWAAILGILGIIYLASLKSVEMPEGLIAVISGAVGAIAGLMVREGSS